LNRFVSGNGRAVQVAKPDVDEYEMEGDEDEFAFLAEGDTPLTHRRQLVACPFQLTGPRPQ
jgi:hypothetical protein